MSNLSDIGFPVQNDQEVNDVIMKVLELTQPVACPQGLYLKFSDDSGAEIYLQGNPAQELIGFNPHFSGKSRRKVGIVSAIQRDSSELDGGYLAWANPLSDECSSGDYEFVFDTPDFRSSEKSSFPVICEIQLTAFASNDFKVFENEENFVASQTVDVKLVSPSFVSSGLVAAREHEDFDLSVARPIGVFSGTIKEFELKTNLLTSESFYWFLIETLGGEIDVVADPKLILVEPKVGEIVSGQFWLSGRLLD